MSIIGYARVSTEDQDCAIQRAMLHEAGCEKIFEEQKSGKTAKDRPELQRCLEYVREGDVLVITKIDRAARSAIDLLKMVELLEEKGVAFRCLQLNVDTTSPLGKFFMTVMGAYAELELANIKERQREGIEHARRAGVYSRPRKKKASAEEILRLKGDGLGMTEIARKLKVDRKTVHRNSPPGTWGPLPESLRRAQENPHAGPQLHP